MKTKWLVYSLLITICIRVGWANGQDTIYVSRDGVCSGNNPCYSTIQDAIDSVSLPSIIKITEETYYEDVVLDMNQVIDLEGGWDTSFTSCSSYTVISGSMMMSDGTMIIGGTGRIILLTPPPTINSFTANPGVINFGESSILSWSITSATSALIDPGVGSVNFVGGSINVSPAATTTYILTASNAMGSDMAQVTVNVIPNNPPTINSFSANPGTINSGESSTLSWTITNATSVSIDQGIGDVDPTSGLTSVSPTTMTTYTLTATNAAGFVTAQITVTVVGGIPPDPEDIAPEIDPTVATNMATATEFLYAGPNPIQIGMTPGTIEAKRAAVLRGKVLTRDGNPFPGVRITILNHPEYGQTLSRNDGMFDLAVNGGGYLTVKYQINGYLEIQRQLYVPWQDFALLPDVILIPVDTAVTPIDLTKPDPIQVARGSVVTDGIGSRQATLLIPSGTTATLVKSDGTTQVITGMNVRATEYTVGNNGPRAMPAELPPTSGYTYCVEVSADEAISAGARSVQFSQPLFYYVENYLNAAVGSIVPVGYYDRVKGVWIPSDNGQVIKIVNIAGSLAEIDTDGDGIPDTGLGLTDAERQSLASLYPVDQELWRVPTSHFTPWDYNWPYGPPPDAVPPKQKPPEQKKKRDCEDEEGGSIIGCQSQTLGEMIDIAGTPYRLHYESDRVPGRKAAYTIDISLSGDTVPDSLAGIELEIQVAGRKFTHNLSRSVPCLQRCPNLGGGIMMCTLPSPGNDILTNQRYTFTWDGKDAYGRTLQGQQPVTVRIGYTYCSVYMAPAQVQQSFAALSGIPITGSVSLNQVTLWQEWNGKIGPWDARGQGLGGWTLNVHHAYDPSGMRLYLGNGDQRTAKDIGSVIRKVAGTGGNYFSGDGGPAVNAALSIPTDVLATPDGILYISDHGNSRIRRVGTDGIITTVAGTGEYGFSGDGGLAINAQLNSPSGIAIGPDGSLYIGDLWNHRIRRVGTDGIITTVAGTGVQGYSGDGGPAVDAQIYGPNGIAIGPDGSIYTAENQNCRIRRIGPDGIITTVAGTGEYGYSGDGGPAKNATFDSPVDVTVGPDGSLYIADSWNHRIRRVGTDGIITTVAGTGVQGYSGDGDPAINAQLYLPVSVTVGPDGSIYIGDYWNYRVRRVGPDGIITTVAGAGVSGYSGDGGPARSAALQCPDGLAVAPDGSLFLSDCINHRVRQMKLVFPGIALGDITLPSEDGNQIYIFNSMGRHLRTIHSLTGSLLYQFGYDAGGRLTILTDGNGNVMTIERDSDGNPTRLISPFGQATTLSLNSNGYLSNLANPAGENNQFTYTDNGLLATLTNPRGFIHHFTYDSLGLLTKDEEPSGGSKTLAQTEMTDGYEVTLTTGMNRVTKYLLEHLPTGDEHRVNTLSDGLKTDTLIKLDGTSRTTLPDGTTVSLQLGPDPRFGMQVPILKSQTLSLPSSLAATAATSRTATLSNPDDPLSLTLLKDEFTINGRKFTTNYAASTMTFTNTSPAGRQVTSKIDSQGRIVEYQIAGVLPVQFTYDTKGRLTSVKQGTGGALRESTFQFNAEGWLQAVTDPLLRTMSFEYDQAGRMKKEVLPDSREIINAYDANGNMTALTPPGRLPHAFTYTPVDLMAEYIPPDIGIGAVKTQYSYNTDRQLTQVLRPDGLAIGFSYDTGGRLSEVTYPGGSVSYAYDPMKGYVAQINSPGGIINTYSYDGTFLTGESWAGDVAGSVSWTYDNSFRVTGISINGNDPILYQYDNDSLITKAGDLTLTRSPQNGFLTDSTIGNVTEAWTYNSFGERSNYTAKYAENEIFKQQFTYDKVGRIVQKIETVDIIATTYEYVYDSTGRLTEVKQNGSTVSTYTYDGNDNRLTGPIGTTTYSYDAQDRLLTQSSVLGTQSYSYTANGELHSKTISGQTTLYNYDVFGSLKSVTLPGGTLIEYIVDGRNRRVGKKVNGSWDRKYLYLNGLKPVAELDSSNTIVSVFVYGSRFNVPEYMIRGGATYRIISDYLGSPRLVVNTATGDIVQRMDYDEFGNVVNDTNPGFQPFGFASGLYDTDTGLVRFGARDYDAKAGRWITKDPGGFSGGPNLYSYAHNDPVNQIDPLGNKPKYNLPKDGWDNLPTQVDWLSDILKIPRGMKITLKGTKWFSDAVKGVIKEAKCIAPIVFVYNLATKEDPVEAIEKSAPVTPETISEVPGLLEKVLPESVQQAGRSWAEDVKSTLQDWANRIVPTFPSGSRP